MKRTSVLVVSALAVILGVSGCVSTEYIEVRPQCTPAPAPTLPAIDRGVTWELLGDERYRELETYINTLWAVHDEQAAMLDELCR